MAEVALTRPAQDDLTAIWQYITRDNLSAADRLIDRIDELCRLYSTQPEAGAPAERLQSGLRYFSVASYVIFYRIRTDGILIIRVLHGARNIEDLFPQ